MFLHLANKLKHLCTSGILDKSDKGLEIVPIVSFLLYQQWYAVASFL